MIPELSACAGVSSCEGPWEQPTRDWSWWKNSPAFPRLGRTGLSWALRSVLDQGRANIFCKGPDSFRARGLFQLFNSVIETKKQSQMTHK